MIFPRIKHLFKALFSRRITEDLSKTTTELFDSWKDPNIPNEQWKIVQPQLVKLKQGEYVPLFEVFCLSIKTCLDFKPTVVPSVLEIGCSSGYYGFVLSQRFPEFSYTGVDFSPEFIAFGKSKFPDLELQVQDAISLKFPSEQFGIVVSGCVLLHLDDWKLGIKESCRVAKNYVIFHRTPVTQAPTALFTKKAYGVKMFEWSFNESEFVAEVESHGFRRIDKFQINSHRFFNYKSRKPQQNTYIFIK